MNKNLSYILCFLFIMIFSSSLRAQDEIPLPVDQTLKKEIVDSIAGRYYEWDRLSMSGKLSSPMLPISPSIKIYMEKGKLLIISAAAPIVGEVARIEIDNNEALIVNKWSDTYTTVSSDRIERICPGGLEAMQNLFLGRITILGSGELSAKNSDEIEIYSVDDLAWMILPNQDMENGSFVYVYFADAASCLLERFAVISADGLGNVESTYTWGKKDMTMNWSAEIGKGTLQATLKLNYPDASAKKISRIELGSKYRKVDPRGILKM